MFKDLRENMKGCLPKRYPNKAGQNLLNNGQAVHSTITRSKISKLTYNL